jgi:hypothetical protein
MRYLGLAAAALLAACATTRPAPQPVAAEVVRAVLVVHLTDGTRCVALTPFTTGTGTFGNCPGLSWRILPERPNILRRVVEEGLALIAADALLAPFAVIAVTDAAGRTTVFASPPPPPTPRG